MYRFSPVFNVTSRSFSRKPQKPHVGFGVGVTNGLGIGFILGFVIVYVSHILYPLKPKKQAIKDEPEN